MLLKGWNKQKKLKNMVDYELDAIGMRCPIPVVHAKRIIKKMTSGETLELKADDPGAKEDIPALLNATGCNLEKMNKDGNILTFLIIKK